MATGEDQVIKCVDCGEDFLFTAGEQSFFREKGLTPETWDLEAMGFGVGRGDRR